MIMRNEYECPINNAVILTDISILTVRQEGNPMGQTENRAGKDENPCQNIDHHGLEKKTYQST